MKIKVLDLVLLITFFNAINLFSASKKRRLSRKELLAQNIELQRRLAQSSTSLTTSLLEPDTAMSELSQSPDLEKGLGGNHLAGAGAGHGALATPISSPHHRVRRHTASIHDHQVAGSVDGLHGTVADFLALQATHIERQQHADEDRNKFESRVYKDVNRNKKIAMLGTGFAVMYTTIGFIMQNWPAVTGFFGVGRHDKGPGAGGSNSTTNSTTGW